MIGVNHYLKQLKDPGKLVELNFFFFNLKFILIIDRAMFRLIKLTQSCENTHLI